MMHPLTTDLTHFIIGFQFHVDKDASYQAPIKARAREKTDEINNKKS